LRAAAVPKWAVQSANGTRLLVLRRAKEEEVAWAAQEAAERNRNNSLDGPATDFVCRLSMHSTTKTLSRFSCLYQQEMILFLNENLEC
jgi:hypothetical protein